MNGLIFLKERGNMKEYKRIITVGAHPLDAELMGGPMSIVMNRFGAKSTFVHVTTGRLQVAGATEQEKQEYLDLLVRQIDEVAQGMGVNAHRLDYLSSNMPSEEEFIQEMMEYFKQEKPDLVITHHIGTMHDRHYYTYKTVTAAVKRLRAQGADIDLLYGENLEDLVGFVPTKYLEMSQEDVDTWFNSLRIYDLFRGKVSSVPYEAYYTTMGKVRGLESSCPNFVKAYMHAGLIDYTIGK